MNTIMQTETEPEFPVDTGGDALMTGAEVAYCEQAAIVRTTSARVQAEGTIIADPKGAPVPHPALEVGRKAQAELRAWGGRFDPPRRRAR